MSLHHPAAIPQFRNDSISHFRYLSAKIYQPIDPRCVLDVIKPFLQYTTYENVAWKQGFGHGNQAATGQLHEPQPRRENLHAKILAQVGRRNVLMLRLRPRAIPGLVYGLHFLSSIEPDALLLLLN